MDYQVSMDHKAKTEEVRVIQEGVIGFNKPFIGNKFPFHIFLKDKDDQIKGGVSGHVWPEIKLLYIDYVYVSEPLRLNGYGTKLMLYAETEAKRQGCASILLDTFSFQAEEFYSKLGFSRIGFIDKHFGDFDHIYMRKDLE